MGALGKGVAQVSATTNARETVFDRGILVDAVPWMLMSEGVAILVRGYMWWDGRKADFVLVPMSMLA